MVGWMPSQAQDFLSMVPLYLDPKATVCQRSMTSPSLSLPPGAPQAAGAKDPRTPAAPIVHPTFRSERRDSDVFCGEDGIFMMDWLGSQVRKWLLSKILIEPVGDRWGVLFDAGPTVPAPGLDDEIAGDTGRLEFLQHGCSLGPDGR